MEKKKDPNWEKPGLIFYLLSLAMLSATFALIAIEKFDIVGGLVIGTVVGIFLTILGIAAISNLARCLIILLVSISSLMLLTLFTELQYQNCIEQAEKDYRLEWNRACLTNSASANCKLPEDLAKPVNNEWSVAKEVCEIQFK